MKRMLIVLLSACMLLTLWGCQGSAPATEPQQTAGAPSTPTDATSPAPSVTPSFPNKVPGATAPSGKIEIIREQGKLRIDYTDAEDSILYVTSPSQLPKYDELAQYDSAFFAEHALILVTKTVGSGSLQLKLEAITYGETDATVKVSAKMDGDIGTDDMATWLLWAVVDTGLNYNWAIQ